VTGGDAQRLWPCEEEESPALPPPTNCEADS
jgi:hypothetical protein